jgi:hypothetical protein
METELRIPYHLPTEEEKDPSYLMKVHSGKPLTVIEKEQWFAYDLDKRHDEFFK